MSDDLINEVITIGKQALRGLMLYNDLPSDITSATRKRFNPEFCVNSKQHIKESRNL